MSTLIFKFYSFGVVVLSLFSSTVYAQSKQGEPLFKAANQQMWDAASLISSYVIVPVGVLMILSTIISIIWGQMTGETHKTSNKIWWILIGVILVGMGVWVGNNGQTIFNQ